MYINNYLSEPNFTVSLKKIEENILFVQHKIYVASKRCNLKLIHNIQINFLENQFGKILFVKRIIKLISKIINASDQYSWKLFIYTYLSIVKKIKPSIFLNYIKEKIRQDIVVILLQPEWYARDEIFTTIRQVKTSYLNLQTRINKLITSQTNIFIKIKKINLYFSKSNKFINVQYLIDKIQSILLISNALITWLYSSSSILIKNNLYKLLEKILYIGIEWQSYINLKIKNIYKKIIIINCNEFFVIEYFAWAYLKIAIGIFIKNLQIDYYYIKYIKENTCKNKINCKNFVISKQKNKQIIFKPSNKLIKILLFNIRSFLYNKNHINQWRLKTNITSIRAKEKIKQLLLNWYQENYNNLDNIYIFKINNIINNIFYTWQRKK